MPGCSALDCSNRSEQGYVMKVFPKDPLRRLIWLSKVKRGNWEPTNNTYLCEIHFDSDQWQERKDGKRKLKKDAIPTLFSHSEHTTKRKLPSEHSSIIKETKNYQSISEIKDHCDQFISLFQGSLKKEIHFDSVQQSEERKVKIEKDAIKTLFSHSEFTTEQEVSAEHSPVIKETQTASKSQNYFDKNKNIFLLQGSQERDIHFDSGQCQKTEEEKKKLSTVLVPPLFPHSVLKIKRRSLELFPATKEPQNNQSNSEIKDCSDKDKIISLLQGSLKRANQIIFLLERKNRALKQRNRLFSLKNCNLKSKLSKQFTKNDAKSVFNEDQLEALNSKKYKNWTEKTIQTALALKLSCGTKGYEHLLALNYPFPSVRTLQRRLQKPQI